MEYVKHAGKFLLCSFAGLLGVAVAARFDMGRKALGLDR
jgi:hypothetical protein